MDVPAGMRVAWRRMILGRSARPSTASSSGSTQRAKRAYQGNWNTAAPSRSEKMSLIDCVPDLNCARLGARPSRAALEAAAATSSHSSSRSDSSLSWRAGERGGG